MIGFLRFVGMVNAALWLGATVFCATAFSIAMNSRDTMSLVGSQYFGLISGAITQIVYARLYQLQILCAILAWLHVVAEWMYLGRIPRRFWLGLLGVLLALCLAGSLWLSPRLAQLQRAPYVPGLLPTQREEAAHGFRLWEGVFHGVNLLMIGGISLYFWRVTHAQDEPRFVSPSKFRG